MDMPELVAPVIWTCPSHLCAQHCCGTTGKALLGRAGLAWACSCIVSSKERRSPPWWWWVFPTFAPTAHSWALLSSCAGREKPGPGWKSHCSVLTGKSRKKQTFLSLEVVLSLLWSYKLQAWCHCWEVHSSLFFKGISPCWWGQPPAPALGCPAPKEKPKLPHAQPERNWKILLSCLFVPPPFPTLHKFSSIIDRYM